MAFQANAYQSDAFQISHTSALRRRRARRLEEELLEKVASAVKSIEQAQGLAIEESKQLESVVKPFRRNGVVQVGMLMNHEKQRIKLEQILTSIRQLEDEILEMLALLLLANEAL